MGAREKILAASEEIFADYGYAHTTVKMICEKADVNIASVNYHFNSKGELYLEAFKSISGSVESKLTQLLSIDTSNKGGKTWEEFIHDFVELVLLDDQNNEESDRWDKILFRELSAPSELFDDIHELYIKPVLTYLAELFALFYPGLSEKDCFMWVTTLISQLCFMKNSRGLLLKERGEEYYSDQNISDLIDHITQTICPPSPRVATGGVQ